eukprot:ANDGO_05896.mRNA.1 Fork-head transcriptional regulator 2
MKQEGFARLCGQRVDVVLQSLSCTIGRGLECDVSVPSVRTLSRHHATIAWRPDLRAFEIQVFGKNGMRINNVQYRAGDRIPLEHGSIVHVADGYDALFLTSELPRLVD